MEELLVKVKNEAEALLIKDLLERLKIQFEIFGQNDILSGEEVKQSVVSGQLAYKNGEMDQFTKIDHKKLL